MADVSMASSNPELLSGSIKWSGLSSGVDFSEVVEQLVAIERINVDRLEAWKATWEEKNKSITALNTRMVSLKLNSQELDIASEFYSRTSSTSNSSVVSVTNTSTAEPGSHSVVVGENIPAQVGSTSFESGAAVGGAAGATMTIYVGDPALGNSVQLVEGVDYFSTDDIDTLAGRINTKDGGVLLEDAYTIVDKTRDGTEYKRLVLTAKVPAGGPSEELTVDDPTDLSLDENSIDPVMDEGTWLGSAAVTSGGTYHGATNKTFTFRVANQGVTELGAGTTDEVLIQWADDEGNSGEIAIDPAEWTDVKEYEVAQGLTLSFSAGNFIQNDSFSVDCFSPVLQQAQEKGLAQSHKIVHEGYSDLITPVSSVGAHFVYRYEGRETIVSVLAGSSLGDLVNAINNDPDNPGVTASIIDDGQGASNSYHLVLTGQETGAEHTIEIVDPTTLSPARTAMDNFDVVGTFETSQKAADCMIKFDGFPGDPAKYIRRPTNIVSDIADGLILDIKNVGGATVTVNNDVSGIQDRVEQFVQSINFVLDYIKEETKYNPDTGESGVMIGNYTYDIVRSSINQILFNAIPGLDSETDEYTHLSQIGISTDPDLDGQWVVDSTKLKEALNNDLEAVARLFIYDDEHGPAAVSGVAHQLQLKMDEMTDDETGIANVLLSNYYGIIDDIDNKIAREERRISMVRERLEEKFARLEMTLGELDGQSQYLQSQLAKLEGGG